MLDRHHPTQDGLYDVAWSEIHENQLVTASGDGSIRLRDVTLNVCPSFPLHFSDARIQTLMKSLVGSSDKDVARTLERGLPY